MESGVLEQDVHSEVNPSSVPNSNATQEIQVPCRDSPCNTDALDTSDIKGDLGQDESTAKINKQDPANMSSDVEIEESTSSAVEEKSETKSNAGIPATSSPQESNLDDKQINVNVSETDDPLLDKSGGDELCDSGNQIPGATQSLYHIKRFKWKGLNTPLILQNENGPCPLLAIINLLILSRKISIPPMQEFITTGQLMEYLGDCILEHAPKRLSEGAQLNYEQNMHDAIGIMCKLQTGLDVNVKFTGVADFEFTPECIVFDLLNIGLYHGWLVDPQDSEEARAVGKLSYNQLVEKIIATKQQHDDSQLVSEGLIAESFLDRTASQLTYHGLCELNAHLKDDELCVFFRNNHFSTLYKHRHELFLLVTDQGFLTEEQVIWETLSNVEGDCVFVDANFRTSPASRAPPPAPPPQPSTSTAAEPMAGISQEDQDYLVALSLQEEQNQSTQQDDITQPNSESVSTLPTEQANPQAYQEWTDLQLAMQLQEEEQRLQQQQARMAERRQVGPQQTLQGLNSGRPVQQAPHPAQENQQRSNGEKCLIL